MEASSTSAHVADSGGRRERRLAGAIAAGLAAAAIVVFLPVARCGFTSLDDDAYVTNNPFVSAGLTLEGLKWAFTTWYYYWHPVTWLSHMLDVELFGSDPSGHHLTNLAIHVTSVVLLFHVLRRMTSAVWPSAFVALVFAIHPLNVETVAWIAERKNVLSGLFWILTMLAYLRWVESPGAMRYAALVVVFGLGLMTKPMLVTLPLVLLLLDVWPLARVRDPFAGSGTWWRLVREKLPLFALIVPSCIFTVLAQEDVGAREFASDLSIPLRIQNAIVSYFVYVAKAVWPANLSVLYPFPKGGHPGWQVAGAVMLLAGTTYLAIRNARARPYFAVGWLWFLGVMVPVSGIMQAGIQGMADRFMYLPMIGLSIAVVWGVRDLLVGRRGGPAVAAIAFVAALGGWGIASRLQLRYWKDDPALFSRMLEQLPDHFISHGMLGEIHLREGRYLQAVTELEIAVRMNPGYAKGYCNLGMALELTGRKEEAQTSYEQAIRIDPTLAVAHYNLGQLLRQWGRLDEAILCFEEALRRDPGLVQAGRSLEAARAERARKP